MASVPYRLAFEVGRFPPLEPWMAIPLVFLASGIVLVFAPNFTNRLLPFGPGALFRKVFSWVYLSFSLIICVGFIASFYGSYLKYREILDRHEYSTADGCVENFRAASPANRGEERISVGGKTFSYTDSELSPAFHQTSQNAGPIRPDSRVIIDYDDDVIIRLKIIDHACPPAKES
jgi:hypothetical protein